MSTPCIVVVEDEALIAADLQDALTHLGYDVPVTVATSTDAIAAVREHRPDLVMLDITLAGSADGITTAAALHRIHTCPVVFLTAHSDAPTLARAKAVEPAGYLVKPFDDRTLHATVEMALARGEADQLRRMKRDQLQLAVDQVDRPLFGLDPDNAVRFVNSAAALEGIAVGQALRTALASFGGELDREELIAAIEARTTDGMPERTSAVFPDEGAVVLLPGTATRAGMLHLCAWCHRARSEQGWTRIESVLHAQHGLSVSHGLCGSCAETQFGEVLT